jgi:hypothetical protein
MISIPANFIALALALTVKVGEGGISLILSENIFTSCLDTYLKRRHHNKDVTF